VEGQNGDQGGRGMFNFESAYGVLIQMTQSLLGVETSDSPTNVSLLKP